LPSDAVGYTLRDFVSRIAAARARRVSPEPFKTFNAVTLGTKLAVIFATLGLAPLLALSAVNYSSGVGAVDGLLRERASERASRVGRKTVRILDAQETRLGSLSRGESLVSYVRGSRPAGDASQPAASAAQPRGGASRATPSSLPVATLILEPPAVPETVSAHFNDFFRNNHEYLQAVTCLNRSGTPLFRLSWKDNDVFFQTTNFMAAESAHDPSVWNLTSPKALRSSIGKAAYGASLLITAPVLESSDGGAHAIGALVAEVRLSDVLKEADEADSPEVVALARAEGRSGRSLVAIDNATDVVVYHTNSTYSHRPAADAMPYFAGVSSRMRSGGEGFDFYEEQDGGQRLAAFRQIEGVGLSLAASEDYSAAAGPVRRVGLFGAALALLAGLAGLAVMLYIARRETHGIEEVARGASAIAAGNLDQRITVSRSGETRELAECFNAMSDRLREHIAREAESRQFQSFLRISAMISHDLKNAIAGLSMLVSNMEKQFHRAEFRADAIDSLREATEKLKRTVARLSEPAKSLSGEYRIAARPTDLAAVIRRVLAINAEPTRPLYEIEAHLPDKLMATVEPERVENVIENLVINALEAMASKGGGKLTVEAGKLDGDLIFFSVADTGVGMSEEFIKTRLFRPFSTTKSKGIGLGLFTCKEIVETHGGRLEVDSSPNSGTRFRVVLPSSLFKSGERRRRPEKVTAATSNAGPGASE
jgi:signal transduction histidine kinase